ncbi:MULTISPECIES: DEAD/DEAH box helicase family protein [unclassified Aureimonas]|uniref:DEAD/DEAH box helicase family protein n=1 Tax=unclassified Aureimonas TaxID=2615206 RepID=UPI000700C6BA|nr:MULTISPECIES: DEAD/DEAH box helicase family protein [unclassified Aureimonas]KQT52470.1 restriction endonuclease subunit R [Aureimonas sp. Leaf427]KQT77629.1 restriction endonuclease subunit R [Aureimonas sp. Leaf460]
MPPAAAPPVFVPRPHQSEARDRILAAKAEGRPGFLLGDLTGLGKTLSAWLAISAMPEREVLVICPKGAIPQWRRTIAGSPAVDKSVTLLNFERTKQLMAPPAVSNRRSVRARNNELARKGSLKKPWPIVVIDESHRIRNPASQQGLVCREVASSAAFTLYMSATAGQSPHELSYLGRLLSYATGGAPTPPGEEMDAFRALMKRLSIGRAKGRWKNWAWEPNERDRDVMSALLYKGPRAIGLRRRPEEIAGWPEVQRELAPTALDAPARRLYDATWREFRRELGLLGGSTRKPAGWAADLRFRQKASLLRCPGTADFAADLLDEDQQVAISVAFLETSTLLADTLRGRGWRVGEINGERSGEANEATRVAFQTGQLDAVLFTVTESISLHRGEMDGGERERSLLVHDMRHSAIQLQQIEGRCHRDGQRAVIYYTYAEETVEERIAALVLVRMSAMDSIAGDDTSLIDAIAETLGQGLD